MYNSSMSQKQKNIDIEPRNIDDCLIVLQKDIPDKEKELLRTGEITTASLHHTAGREIRNKWKLWGNSELENWFQSIGVWHPDDMSSIILDSFVKVLRKEPIDLEEQVKIYQDYWKTQNENIKNFTVEYSKEGKVKII